MGDVLQIVMFHAFKASDPAAEAQIALAAGSARQHYPESEILLITNPLGQDASLPDWIIRKPQPVDFERIMFDRACSYREHVRSVPPGTKVVFLDTDMLVIRRFDELLAPGADISTTLRDNFPAPVNGGLIIADTARHGLVAAFFDRLVAAFDGLPEEEKRWDGDQSALKLLIDPPIRRITETLMLERDGLTIRLGPAQVFNHTPRRLMLRLGLFRPGARVLHFKGGRKARMKAYARRYLSRGFLGYLRRT